MYFPDRARVFYRVGWYDNILDGDRMSLYVEVGAPHDGGVRSPRRCGRRCSRISRARAHHRRPPAGLASPRGASSPAYCHITKASLAEHARLHAVFEAANVHSVGRYGRWTYCSIEDNLIETRELAARL
jgi:hypothetical protein